MTTQQHLTSRQLANLYNKYVLIPLMHFYREVFFVENPILSGDLIRIVRACTTIFVNKQNAIHDAAKKATTTTTKGGGGGGGIPAVYVTYMHENYTSWLTIWQCYVNECKQKYVDYIIGNAIFINGKIKNQQLKIMFETNVMSIVRDQLLFDSIQQRLLMMGKKLFIDLLYSQISPYQALAQRGDIFQIHRIPYRLWTRRDSYKLLGEDPKTVDKCQLIDTVFASPLYMFATVPFADTLPSSADVAHNMWLAMRLQDSPCWKQLWAFHDVILNMTSNK